MKKSDAIVAAILAIAAMIFVSGLFLFSEDDGDEACFPTIIIGGIPYPSPCSMEKK